MPRKLVAAGYRKASLQKYEDPSLKSGQIRIKVEYASPKHGTELPAFRGEDPFAADLYDEDWRIFLKRDQIGMPEVNGKPLLGNQWVGVIVELGPGIEGFRVGERVCGYGGIQETQIVQAVGNPRLFRVPEGMPWKNALCLDPAQFAFAGIRDSDMRVGDRVAIFGLGAIGAIAAQMVREAGASFVAVIDPIPKRRDAALQSGADVVLDPAIQDVGLELKKATDRLGVDAVVETSGNERALQQALRGLAYGGTIAFVGWARAFGGSLDLGKEAHFNAASLVFSRASSEPNRDHPRWDRERIIQSCWDMLAAGRIDCSRIVDPVVPFAKSPWGYEEFVDRHPEDSVKLGVDFT